MTKFARHASLRKTLAVLVTFSAFSRSITAAPPPEAAAGDPERGIGDILDIGDGLGLGFLPALKASSKVSSGEVDCAALLLNSASVAPQAELTLLANNVHLEGALDVDRLLVSNNNRVTIGAPGAGVDLATLCGR